MTELIELRFKYTEDEFAEAWQFYATRSYLKKVDVLVALLLILVSLIMIAINGYEWLWGLLFVIGFIFLVLNFIGYFVTPRQRFRRVVGAARWQRARHVTVPLMSWQGASRARRG